MAVTSRTTSQRTALAAAVVAGVLTVTNGTAMVVCGNVHTANATVSIIDTVLTSKS